jgi:photosystem II stability/assembly factor-like uncharacterized protein
MGNKNKILKIITLLFLITTHTLLSQWVNISNVPTTRLNAVKFFNESTGITAGYGGIWRTTDGGYNWTRTLTTGNFTSISFFDYYDGTAVGDSGIIYRTTNNGVNWAMEYSPTTNNLYSVSCPAISPRFAIGQNGVFLRYFVNNWSLISTLGYDFYDIKMRTTNNGYIVGTSSSERVMNTANGGANWLLSFFTSGRLNSVFCKSSNIIVAVGTNSRIRISTDYGYNWIIPILEPNYEFFSVTFPVNDTGFVAGSSGKIFRSTNGGYNWISQSSGIGDTLRSVSFINSKTGWVVGNNGIVLRTVTGGIVGRGQLNNKTPNRFKLYQNYPNPFNPKTRIKFDLNENSIVHIKVYDVRGCFSTELLNEYKNAGENHVEFDGSDFASGIYIYVIKVNELTDSKTMVLIK